MPPASKQSSGALNASQVLRNEAEAEAHSAAAARHKVETRRAVAEAKAAEIELRTKERAERNILARDELNLVYVFDDGVNESSVKKCVQQLTLWSRQQPGCDIELQINSPGGSIFDGFALIDFLRSLRNQGHKVTTVAFGMAASMGGVILQAGDVRVMGKHSFMLIHEGSLGAIGDFGKVEDRVDLMKKLHAKILALFTERSTKNATWIKNRWKRQDWWIPAEEALELGFVDEVR